MYFVAVGPSSSICSINTSHEHNQVEIRLSHTKFFVEPTIHGYQEPARSKGVGSYPVEPASGQSTDTKHESPHTRPEWAAAAKKEQGTCTCRRRSGTAAYIRCWFFTRLEKKEEVCGFVEFEL